MLPQRYGTSIRLEQLGNVNIMYSLELVMKVACATQTSKLMIMY